MPNGDRLLREWSNPLFVTAPKRSRDLYFFCLTASPLAAPLGLIWYGGDKLISSLARKAQVSFVADLEPLEKLGLAKHDVAAGLVYFMGALEGGLIRAYGPRNISSWKKRVEAMPESQLKEEWRAGIVAASINYPKNISAKIYQIFASKEEFKDAPGGKASSSDALEVVRYFADKFSEKGHGPYIGSWSKEVQVAKELLLALTCEDIKVRIDLYFKDEWLCSQASLDFMSFRRNINKFAKSANTMPTKKDLSGYWDIVNRGGK